MALTRNTRQAGARTMRLARSMAETKWGQVTCGLLPFTFQSWWTHLYPKRFKHVLDVLLAPSVIA